MKRTITAATVAASLAVGGLAGTVLGTPVVAGAAEAATGAAGWVQGALQGLVDDGTITEAQSEAVATALEDARPERWSGHHGVGHHVALATMAEALGVTEDELRTALVDGRTVAEVAGDRGVDVQVVIDAVVAEVRERVDERAAAGDLTAERADDVVADAEERATAFVNGDGPALRGGPGGRFHGRHGHRGPGEAGEVPPPGGDGI